MIRERVNRLNTDLNLTTKKVDGILASIFDCDGQPHIWTGDIVDNRKYNLITNLINIALAGDRIEGDKITLDGDVYATEDFTLEGMAVIGGIIESFNWGLTTGGQINVDEGTIKFGGSVAPLFSVDATGKLTCTGADVSGKITVGADSSGIANLTDAGDLATLSLVETAQLGTTVIVGGYIKTGLVSADNINVGTLVVARTAAKCTDANADQTSAHDCQHPGDYTSTIINGGLVTTGTLQLSDGSNIKAGLTAVGVGDANIRIWAGDTYANRATADFRVTQGGAVTCNNITITGGGTASLEVVSDVMGALTVNDVLTMGAGGKIDLTNNSELTKNHLYLTQIADSIQLGSLVTGYHLAMSVGATDTTIAFSDDGAGLGYIGVNDTYSGKFVCGFTNALFTGTVDSLTGFKLNGVAGVDKGPIDPADLSSITISKGIITDAST